MWNYSIKNSINDWLRQQHVLALEELSETATVRYVYLTN